VTFTMAKNQGENFSPVFRVDQFHCPHCGVFAR
jgi:hypothetical protein